MWFHSINDAADVSSIYEYIEEMLRAEQYVEPPPDLQRRRFDRYL